MEERNEEKRCQAERMRKSIDDKNEEKKAKKEKAKGKKVQDG